MADKTLRLPVRQYIAVPSGKPKGLTTYNWDLNLAQTAFIELHCWNVGVPGGIPVPDDYWVFMGSKANHRRMARIVKRVIVPCMEAARQAGMPTVHVQPDSAADRYPELRPAHLRRQKEVECAADSEQETEEQAATIRSSNHAVERAERVHGRGYMSWDGWDHLDVAPSLKPEAGDVMVASTAEFHQWLQERHITTLIYTGFCSNLCIVSSPAAMAPMNGLGYRCVLLREGTMAVEFPDQPQNLHTDASLRYIESWVGYTASVSDFLAGLKG